MNLEVEKLKWYLNRHQKHLIKSKGPSNSLNSKVENGHILDLFAGSGSYGLESISRGAKHVLFNDVKQAALITLNENIASLNVLDKSTVWKLDYTLALKDLKNWVIKLDVIFIDPPYIMDIYESVANELYDPYK